MGLYLGSVKLNMAGVAQITNVYLGTLQVWAHEIVAVLSAGNNQNIQSLFPQHWDQDVPKRVVSPAGLELGATSLVGALRTMDPAGTQANSWKGLLTLEVYGTISGIGGAANSGVGGNAINVPFKGRDGQKLRLVFKAGALVRSGGGGGGRGGNGGNGQYPYTHTEGPSGPSNSYHYIIGYDSEDQAYHRAYWGSMVLNGSGLSRSGSAGGWNYALVGWAGIADRRYAISRSQTRQQATTGGVAGNAGRGQGFDGAATTGATAVAGSGTNAGASGKSGDGGAWGAAGQAGAVGANGTVSTGAAGATAGPAGYYLLGQANVDIINEGATLLGRIA